MKCHALGFAALLSFGLHVHAAAVHVDVASDGDIAVDVDMKPKTPSRPGRGHSGRPVYPSRKAAHDLEEYQVKLSSHVHAGKLSVSGMGGLPEGGLS